MLCATRKQSPPHRGTLHCMRWAGRMRAYCSHTDTGLLRRIPTAIAARGKASKGAQDGGGAQEAAACAAHLLAIAANSAALSSEPSGML
jgi:hypothetical protein